MKNLRKLAGRAKFYLLDYWPYYWLHKRSLRIRETQKKRIATLAPCSSALKRNCEIHLLCGGSNIDMGIWSSWSFKRHYPRFEVYLHSDGSIHRADIELWKRIIPDLVFIDPKAPNPMLDHFLSLYPNIAKFRDINVYSKKLIDFHLVGRSEKILFFDTDVLCFKEPTEITNAIENDQTFLTWNKDNRDAFPGDRAGLESIATAPMVPLFNSGLVVSKRFGKEQFCFIEHLVTKMLASDIKKTTNLEQAVYSFCAAKFERSQPLPKPYQIYSGYTRFYYPVRHFVGVRKIRPRFFTEGVPMLLKYNSRHDLID